MNKELKNTVKKYAEAEDVGAPSEEKSSNEELSDDEYDSQWWGCRRQTGFLAVIIAHCHLWFCIL